MDQNNDRPEQLWTFWDFFFLWTYFSGPTHVWGFFVLVQNFDDRLCGEKARNGSTGPTYKPRCPANVRYRKLGMGLKMDKFKKKAKHRWTRNNMDQNNDGPEQLWTFWDFFFLWTYFSGP